MKIKWTYDLPTDESSHNSRYESPIFVKDGTIYFITRETKKAQLHMIDAANGTGKMVAIPTQSTVIPSQYFFMDHKDKLLIYTGELWVFAPSDASFTLLIGQKPIVTYIWRYGPEEPDGVKLAQQDQEKITSTLRWDEGLFLTTPSLLYRVDLDTLTVRWVMNLENEKPYGAGPVTCLGDRLACYGHDKLLFIEPSTGEITDEIKVPRVDKLFCPLQAEDGGLFIGYANWTNMGILKYDTATKKVLWRHKRNHQILSKTRIHRLGQRLYYMKGETELVCIHADTGEQIFGTRTDPWLYTDLEFRDLGILFGTSGGNGYLNLLDPETGDFKWRFFLKNGCAFYDTVGDTALVGDNDKIFRQIHLRDGRELQHLELDGEVIGQVTANNGYVYTVIRGHAQVAVRLVCIEI